MAEPTWVDCPDAEWCQRCPCAAEDDVCFPGERLRVELKAAEARVAELETALRDMRDRAQSLTGCKVSETVLWALSNMIEDMRVVLDEPLVAKGDEAK